MLVVRTNASKRWRGYASERLRSHASGEVLTELLLMSLTVI